MFTLKVEAALPLNAVWCHIPSAGTLVYSFNGSSVSVNDLLVSDTLTR
jgi:hypothetical protein